MVWVELADKNYANTGLKAPVFFKSKMQRTRVFVDVDEGKIQLEYSYDTPFKCKKLKREMQWQKLESGFIENDFAFEMLGISAVRLRVLNAGKQGARVHVFQNVTEEK